MTEGLFVFSSILFSGVSGSSSSGAVTFGSSEYFLLIKYLPDLSLINPVNKFLKSSSASSLNLKSKSETLSLVISIKRWAVVVPLTLSKGTL